MPPGGYSTGLAEPRARTVQETRDQGRRVTFTWLDPPFRPEPPHSNQAYGICFTQAGLIVLGGGDAGGERYWNLLGGGVEPGETLEGCLAREVMEEGCARVVKSRYIGCQRVDDPEHPSGFRRYYQTRFWARVDLLPWDPQHEIDERRLVRPDEFLRTLSWGTAPTAAIILEEGLKAEGRHGQRLRPGGRSLEMRTAAAVGIRSVGIPVASTARPQQRYGHHARTAPASPVGRRRTLREWRTGRRCAGGPAASTGGSISKIPGQGPDLSTFRAVSLSVFLPGYLPDRNTLPPEKVQEAGVINLPVCAQTEYVHSS